MKITDKNIVLEIKNLSKDFGGLRATNDVSMKIEKGEIRGLIGPNGAGKSTIFKLIMGLHKPTEGNVVYVGKDITKVPTWKRVREGIAIKMQIPGVYGELTGEENLRIAAMNYHKSKNISEQISNVAEMLNIQTLLPQKVKNLSHGQQQWLEISMSLMSNPKLLLLDEPAAGMGPEETNFTAKMIRKLSENNITIVFIDHDMAFVKKVSKLVTVLHNGEIFKEGTIKEIEKDPEVIEIYLGTS